MRVPVAFGAWLLLLTAAWLTAALPWEALGSAQGAALWWQLRQHALYLSGVWSIGMMSLVMLLSLRQRWMEWPLGGMDQVYRLHKWAGIAAAVAAVLHWAADESSDFIKDIWGKAGRPAREVVWSWAVDWRGSAKDVGEFAFYALLVMVVHGAVDINGQPLQAGQLAQMSRTGTGLQLTAHASAKLLILGGEPIPEPVMGQGPFVMNTREELAQAFHDFSQGKFGTMPAQSSPPTHSTAALPRHT